MHFTPEEQTLVSTLPTDEAISSKRAAVKAKNDEILDKELDEITSRRSQVMTAAKLLNQQRLDES